MGLYTRLKDFISILGKTNVKPVIKKPAGSALVLDTHTFDEVVMVSCSFFVDTTDLVTRFRTGQRKGRSGHIHCSMVRSLQASEAHLRGCRQDFPPGEQREHPIAHHIQSFLKY